jgi:hypothetical protein
MSDKVRFWILLVILLLSIGLMWFINSNLGQSVLIQR